MSAFKNLLSPLQIGGLRLPNRVIMAPMGTEMGTEDGRSTPREAAYYAARAAGGTALVMTGVNFIQSDLEPIARSEERRVGKECRARGRPQQRNKNEEKREKRN